MRSSKAFNLRLYCGIVAMAILAAFEIPAKTVDAVKAEPIKVQGVLIDHDCSYKAETRIVPGPRLEGGMLAAYVHTRQCALMPPCLRSGYGVFTYDTNKFLAFDAAGNQKALQFFKQAKKEEDFRVEVTGEMRGSVLKVTSIRMLT